MAKYLVIIESPGKIKKFNQYLSKDYKVIASIGHLLDLPDNKFGVNLKKDFECEIEVDPDKEHVIKEILTEAKKADTVYMATDGDREGSLISWNIYNYLIDNGVNKDKFKRAKAYSITKPAIEEAINNATSIDADLDLIHAAQARRILDRIVGFRASFPVQQATGGKSAGRTQSSGLRILADREKEIQSFIPEIYWPIEAELLTDSKEKIVAQIKSPKPLDIKTQDEANTIIGTFKKGPIKVSDYSIETYKANPYAPFTTSSLQQAASSFLGFSPDKTMKVAQSLYETGKISYHRSDSTVIVSSFVDSIRSYISGNFEVGYISKSTNVFKTASKNAQEAHEAVRPTDINLTDCVGSGIDEVKLYELIWRRTVASQMSPAEYEKRSAEFSCGKYVLSATGSKEKFDGFRKVWKYTNSEDRYLPDLKVGDTVVGIDFKTEKKETKPPSRFSEASIVSELEKNGIGRPSTYAAILSTLKDRKYIEVSGKSIKVCDLGMKVIDFMVKTDFCFINTDFTSKMEDNLDEISNGKMNKTELLTKYWDRLKADILNAKTVKTKGSVTEFDCPLCGTKMVKKHSKFGEFFGCGNYPECKHISKIGKDGKPLEKSEAKEPVVESSTECPNCGELLVVRKSKKGNSKYLGCRNWKDPKCQGFYDFETGKKMDFSKSKGKKWTKKKKEE